MQRTKTTPTETLDQWRKAHPDLVAAVARQITRLGRYVDERSKEHELETRLELVRSLVGDGLDLRPFFSALFPGREAEEAELMREDAARRATGGRRG